jgi:hypothetical protein
MTNKQTFDIIREELGDITRRAGVTVYMDDETRPTVQDGAVATLCISLETNEYVITLKAGCEAEGLLKSLHEIKRLESRKAKNAESEGN